jgi:hypothetical protein
MKRKSFHVVISFPFVLLAACSSKSDSSATDSASTSWSNRRSFCARHPDRCPPGTIDLGSAPAPDLATAPVPPDLATAPAPRDLATAPAPRDLAMAPPRDLASPPPPPDLSTSGPKPDLSTPPSGTAPTLSALDPAYGPAGTALTLTGRFASGDVVKISGTGIATATLAVASFTTSAIVAWTPTTLPGGSSVNVTVERSGVASAPQKFGVTTGKTYYIATTGSDSNPGTIAAPWRNLDVAGGKVKPGDLIYVRGGTYNSAYAITASGTAGAPITFMGYPGETATIVAPVDSARWDTLSVQGSYLVFDHLHFTDLHNPGSSMEIVAASHDVTLSNCEVYGSLGVGFMLVGSYNLIVRTSIHDNGNTHKNEGLYIEGAHNTVRNCLIYNNWDYGLQLYDELAVTPTDGYNTIEGNWLYHNGYPCKAAGISNDTAGMIVSQGHANNIIRNNVFCDNADYAIQFDVQLPNQNVTGNVSCYNHSGGFFFPAPGTGDVFTGNISYNDAGWALSLEGPVASDNNYYWNGSAAPGFQYNWSANMTLAQFQAASGQDLHSKIVDPKFKNVPTSGFDSTKMTTYDFCTTLNPALCTN